jgi:TolB protein
MKQFLLVTLVLAATSCVAANSAAARPRGINGKIVTNSDNLVTGEEQVYTVDPDGTNRTLLANNSETGQWSHDGSRISIGLAPFGGAILQFDTGVVTGLSLDAQYPGVFLGCGLWSADDARLACEGLSDGNPAFNGIYTVRSSDGGDLRRVTSDPGGDDCPSDYSPNGKRLVFTRANETTYALFTVKLDGSGLRQITPAGMEFNFCNGNWSPQGNEIVFGAHVPSDQRSTLWVVHSDGSGLRQIPIPGCGGPLSDPSSIGCFNPSWSPDGQKIVFARGTADGRDLYTVDRDGSGLFPVTNTPDINELGGDWGTHALTP